jgi:CelD/BcsL family acetyltransferase involved in cellulose biosynthesis
MAVDVALFNDLDAAARDADRALDRDAQPWLFDRVDWFQLVHEHTPEGEPLVVRVRNGVARCWLFLSVRGRHAEALSNWYCLRYGPIAAGAPGAKAPLEGLASGLRRAGISSVFLEPLAKDDPLPKALRSRGWAIRRCRMNVSWRIDTQGMSFDDYWASRPSKLRNTAARRARKAKLRIAIHDRFDEAAWADYESVYEASWKPEEGSPPLIRQLAIQEGAAGTLRLGLAYSGDRPVAAQLWLVENDIATIHKLAYREDARFLSPGTVLSVEMFRRALDVDKVATIDFGMGNDAYKAEWMSHCVPLYSLSAYDMLRPAGIVGIIRSIGSKIAARLRRR